MEAKYLDNRTRLYLAPIIHAIDPQLVKRVIQLDPFAWGVNDVYYKRYGRKKYPLYTLFLLFRVQSNPEIGRVIDEIRRHQYFIDDYIYNLKGEPFHVVMIRSTRRWSKTFSAFRKGQFSDMFSIRDLRTVKMRPKSSHGLDNEVYQVLTKDPKYKKVFHEKLREMFEGNVPLPEEPYEYGSFMLESTIEVFNSNENPGFLVD